MKPIYKIAPVAVLVVSFFALVLNSCKKTNNTVNNNNDNAENSKARAIAATIQRYGSITAPVIFQPNMPAPSISYMDQQGNVIQFAGTQNRTAATCGQYTCATAPSASDLYVISTLQYVKWFYKCGTGHDLTATWSISAPYTLLLQDPNNSSNYSYGNIRIKSGSTVLATSGNLGNGNLKIVNSGTDPNCSSNTLFVVTYTWSNVSDSYFPGNAVDAQLTIYNNCSITNYNNIIGWTGGPPYTSSFQDVFTHPCDRTDQAYVNPPSLAGSPYATIVGAYVICSPPSGFTGTTQHQVEYRPVTITTSDLWEDQPNSGLNYSPIYFGIIPGTGTSAQTMNACCDVLNLTHMTLSSGKWIVRYRNIYGSSCAFISGTPPVNWTGVWHQEVWNLH